MNRKIKILMDDFKKSLSPIKKDIYSLILHGSSIHSNSLKQNQDLDILFVLNEYDFTTLRKLKRILKKFCKENSKKNNLVYYSMAGDGRGAFKQEIPKDNQGYKLEIFIVSKSNLFLDIRYNKEFYYNMAKNFKILIGKNFTNYSKFSGYVGNLKYSRSAFDRLQWMYASILEFGENENFIRESCQESIFGFLRMIFKVYGIEQDLKDKFVETFKKNFPKNYMKYKELLVETKNMRKGKKSILNTKKYLHLTEKFGKFTEEILDEKTR